MNDIEKTVEKWAEDNGITLQIIFVPFSVSRNRESKNPSLNYIVHLTSGKFAMSTEFMKGCGHLPLEHVVSKSHHTRVENNLAKARKEACESGKFNISSNVVKIKRINGNPLPFPKPNICEVLHSLMLDNDVMNYSSFKEWAEMFGYNSDSIKDKKIYEACQEIAEQFNKLLTKPQRNELRELLQDY